MLRIIKDEHGSGYIIIRDIVIAVGQAIINGVKTERKEHRNVLFEVNEEELSVIKALIEEIFSKKVEEKDEKAQTSV